MYFLNVASKDKIRRSSWPEYDYIQLRNIDQPKEGGYVMYWNNQIFKWFQIKLTLSDLAAMDWVEA